MNIKKILVPTDFSDSSKAAVSYAIEMALKLEARLYLMHSMEGAFSMSSERLLEQLINDDRFRKIEAQTITEIGDPGSAILRESEEIGADLIMMGSKGSSGGRKLLGSTTTEVISKSDVPVLVVPQNSSFKGFEDIVFMTDFNDGDLSALKELLDWARYFNASLHVLHIFTDESFQDLIRFKGFKEVVKERIDYDKLSFERAFNPSFDEGFFNYMKTRNPNLVVLTRYKKSFFQKLMDGDHIRHIEFEATIPFLTLTGDKYMQEDDKQSSIE